MKFEGKETLPESTRAVWRFLSDPAAVGQCIPGLKSLQPVVPGKQYRLAVEVNLGLLRPIFELEVFLTATTPERQARMWLRGRGPDSHLGGSSYVDLSDLGTGETELHWAFFVAAAGWISSLGDRLLRHAFRRASRSFLDRLRQRLGDRLPEVVPSLTRSAEPLRVAV